MIVLLVGFFAYYLTKIFLFEHKESHFGPWPSSWRVVRHIYRIDLQEYDAFHTYQQPVTLFDWVRRIFGLYEIIKDDPLDDDDEDDQEIWIVRERRLELWTCPTCLSFWSGAIVSILLLMVQRDLLMWPLNWGILAGISAFLSSTEDFFLSSQNTLIVRDDYDASESQ